MFDLRQLERAHATRRRRRCRRRRRMHGRCWRERLGATVIVKHENHTPTGAFKVRGGLVYVDRLKRERPGTPGTDLGDARQSRPESRLRGAPSSACR